MTLGDTGPMVALIDRDDPHHVRCVAMLATLPPSPILTTWPCLVEAMYLLGRAGGIAAQDELWGFLADGLIAIHQPAPDEWGRMRQLMNRYRDTPMDLADASLVSAAEAVGTRRVFSLDRHFHVYRINDRDAFEVLPLM